MSESINTTSVVSAWAAQGRKFTDARNAGVAHLLATGVKASVIVAETGLDKGDVSRVNKLVKELAPAQVKSLKSMPLTESNVESYAKFGEKFLRRVKGEVASRTEKSPEDKFRTALATAFDLIVANPESESAWLALIADLFTPEEFETARATADAEEVAA